MRRVVRSALIVCLSLVVSPTALAADEGEVAVFSSGFWLPLPDLPESKEQFGLEACAGRIYAVGGICEGRETASAFVYDLEEGQWSVMAPLPRAVQSLCLATVNGRLFCFGGYDSRLAIKYDDVWQYDPQTDAWLPRCPMPIPREDAGSAVINGQVWIVGGLTNFGHELVGQIDVYDPNLDTWVLSATLVPHGTDWAGRALGDFACGLGSFLYCLGGAETMDHYSRRLLPATWGFFTDGVTLEYIDNPDPRCYAEVVAVGDLLCVVGGVRRSLTDFAETMPVYDTQRHVWRSPVRLPYAARGQGACSWNGTLYLGGGYNGFTRRDFCQWVQSWDHWPLMPDDRVVPESEAPEGTVDLDEQNVNPAL